jgi:hypothetical protein
VIRKIMAVAAASGALVGTFVFIGSFFGLTMNKLGARVFLLHLGIFVLAIPLIFVERSKGADWSRGKPHWALRSMQLAFLLFIGVFVTFLILSHAAAPDVVNGEYVLNSHGKIVGYLSEKDYLFLKGWELRLFASGWIGVYWALAIEWWFPRQDEWTVLMPD